VCVFVRVSFSPSVRKTLKDAFKKFKNWYLFECYSVYEWALGREVAGQSVIWRKKNKNEDVQKAEMFNEVVENKHQKMHIKN